jgi:hypothetical protein
MLEAPTGRLKWEPNDQGIRVELPAPLDMPNILRHILAMGVSILLVAYLVFWKGHDFHETSKALKFFVLFAPCVAGEVWGILARRTILTLTPSEMTLNNGTLEIGMNRRVFANRRLHNLRYCKFRWEPTAERQRVKDSIICEVEGRTIAIMSGISKEEATALIEKMMAIYKFPNTLRADNPGR